MTSAKQTSSSEINLRFARHIAGHAVIASAQGVEVRYLTIGCSRPAFSHGGGLWIDNRTLVDFPVHWPPGSVERLRLAEKLIRITLAGSVTESLFELGLQVPIKWRVCAQDWQLAWTTAELLHPDKQQREAYLTTCLQRLHAFMQIQQYLDQVLRISDALLERKELGGEEIKAILAEPQATC